MSKYFRQEELACKCGCGLSRMDPAFVALLDLVREHAGPPPGIPLVVDSGCRCAAHNAAVGGSPSSSHLVGTDGLCHAVDIRAIAPVTRFRIIASALSHGINRIGIGRTFIHLDNDPSKPPTLIWLY